MIKKIFERLNLKFANSYKRAEIYRKKGVRMGKNCQVFMGVNFGSEPYLVSFGDNVKVTADNSFITHDGGVEVLRNLGLMKNADVFGVIKVGSNVFFGNRCIIMPNVKIGDNVVIGAGSIVTRDIPSNSIAVGVPCKVIKTIDQYHQKCKDLADYTFNLSNEDKEKYLRKKYNI